MVYDYYKLLGINEDATSSEIKASFRDAAKKYHPDVNKNNPKASDLFAVINQGYQILSNKRKKTSYDYILAQNKFYDIEIERNYSNTYAQQVSRSRKHRYSNEAILKRKRKRFELQRKKEAHIVSTFKSKAESFPLIYRYSINSLLGLTGLVMGYQNWFVSYIDGMGFIKLFFSFALATFGVFSVVNLAYQHLFVMEITGKTKKKHDDASMRLLVLLLVACITIFSGGTILKKHFELKYNSDYTKAINVTPHSDQYEYVYKVNGVKYMKRQTVHKYPERLNLDKFVVKHSKSNPKIAELIILK